MGRELNRRLKKRFDELRIEIPPAAHVRMAGDKPLQVRLAPAGREQLKALVRLT